MVEDNALTQAAARFEAGDLALADTLVERILAAAPEHAEALQLKARLLLRQRQPGAAAQVLQRVVALRPDAVDVWIDLGRAHNNDGRLDAACEAFGRAGALDPGNADAWAFRGHALRGLGQLDEAAVAFDEALLRDESHLRALKGLGSVQLALGHPGKAAAALKRAVAANPGDADAYAYLGAALHRSADPEGAEAAYREALSRNPRHGEAWLNLGITLQDTGRLAGAIEAYRQTTVIQPRSTLALNRLADAQLAAGHSGEALQTTSACLAADPGNSAALAARALALNELGRDAEAHAMLDYRHLVRPLDIRAPAGFADVAAFNAALREHVLSHPSLSYEPEGHATRGGRHTGDLLDGEMGPVAVLEGIVLEAAARYVRELGTAARDFVRALPPRPRLAMWAVVMDTEGYQLPHIHPAAMLSGVYYVDLPASIGAGDEDVAGWIEFGLPPEDIHLKRPPPVALQRPVEGRLFLFPSYFYHRTIPFPGAERRICIAFDVPRPVAA